MSASGQPLAWFAGRWGTAEELSLPLQDRGLRLADGLFETMLVEAGQPLLLREHLERWRQSAELLAMAAPPEASWLQPLLDAAIARAGLATDGCGALRLNWSRGDGAGRGIDLPPPGSEQASGAAGHRFWLQLTPCTPAFSPQTVWISRRERRNATSVLSRCKTFAYGQAIQARREAHQAGAEEALLLSGDGQLCCGAVANVLVQRRGRWLTPATASGCLPGVLRGRALALGLAEETRLQPVPEPGDRWLLINSLGCRPIASVDGHELDHHSAAEAEGLWRQLL